MCHHRDSDWFAERTRDPADETDEPSPGDADELTGREMDEPAVAESEPEFDERDVDAPELADDEERPAAALETQNAPTFSPS